MDLAGKEKDEERKLKNEEIIQTGTLSVRKIGNLCKLRCPDCATLFNSVGGLRKHCNHSDCETFQHEDLYKYLDKSVTHRCKICSKLLLCDWAIIHSHIQSHKIKSLEAYAETTGCIIVGNKREKETIFYDKTNKAKSLKKIGAFCSFKCDKCDYTVRSWSGMRTHLKKLKHGCLKSKGWHNYIDEIVMHQCQICQKKILNERTFLGIHFNKTHHLTVPQYVEAYNVPRSC